MHILVHLGLFSYSLAITPVTLASMIISALPPAIPFAWDLSFSTAAALLMLGSGALSILFVIIPYASSLFIDNILSKMDVWELLYYHAIVFWSISGNFVGAWAVYFYSTILIDTVVTPTGP